MTADNKQQPLGKSTSGEEYANRLVRLSGARWKQALDVQAPYRRHIQRLTLGKTLDVGCGIGRNLGYLNAQSVGVDHNADSIATARERGLTAYTSVDFFDNTEVSAPGTYDSMLAAHLVEHLTPDEAVEILQSYIPCLKSGGRVVLICPQEAGYKTDATHVSFTDFDLLNKVGHRLGLTEQIHYSFPFHRRAGKIFPYNEFVYIGRKA